MAAAKVQTGLRLDEELYEKVKILSDKEGRSINNLAEYIIRLYVSAYEQKNGPLSQPHD